jgi:hypothetical protein
VAVVVTQQPVDKQVPVAEQPVKQVTEQPVVPAELKLLLV